MFFSFDGIDGGGKSTQLELLADWLREQGHEVVTCRDPGSTQLGEAVRGVLLGADFEFGFRAELLLYMACRAQLVDEVIRPALKAGKVVISDRYVLASVVYQGVASDLEPEEIWRVGEVATHALMPQMTFVLDLDPELAASRLDGKRDRIESRGLTYFEAVRNGFLQQAARFPDAHQVLDATESVDQIQTRIRDAVQQYLNA